MKKYIPFVFPAIALMVVLFLGFRWYTAQTMKPDGKVMGEGMKIDELSADEAKNMRAAGSKDLLSVELKGTGEGIGQVRYEVRGEKVYFTVSADLPALKEGMYQVWLRQLSGDVKTKAFVLEEGKAGYIGSASVAASTLPFEVILSQEMSNDNTIETTLLTGIIQK